MVDVKTGDVEIREFLDTPLTRSRSQGRSNRSSDGLLMWMNVWLCCIMVILLFQTVYSIIVAHRAEQKVRDALEQMQNVSAAVGGVLGGVDDDDWEKERIEHEKRMKVLNEALQDHTPLK